MDARTALPIFATVLAIAAVMYGLVGRADTHAQTDEATVSSVQKTSNLASVSNLLGPLEERLAENPDDAKGWLLLAKSYDHLGDNDRALAAYQEASRLGMTDTALEVRLTKNSFDKDDRE